MKILKKKRLAIQRFVNNNKLVCIVGLIFFIVAFWKSNYFMAKYNLKHNLIEEIIRNAECSKNKINDKLLGKKNRKIQTIVIDAGHGGYDSGKVGCNGAYEKDINLNISRKLFETLQKQGYMVYMTRKNDEMLGNENNNKKRSDMLERVRFINSCKPDIMISIHQNSFTDCDVYGAQVFYLAVSKEGKNISELLQNNIVKIVDATNKRKAKGSEGYYILENINCTGIIVECGFLSNKMEADKLVDEMYQNKIVSAIVETIENYNEN